MDANQQSIFDKQVKELTTLHYALVAGLIIVNGVLYTQTIDPELRLTDTEDVFLYIVPLLAISGVFFSQFLFKKKLGEIAETPSFEEKLMAYRSASVMKFALIEGPALIAILFGFINGNLLYSIIGAILTVYLFLQRVTKDKARYDLAL